MALQTIFPTPYCGIARLMGSVNFTTGATTLDAAGEYYCFILQAKENMVISHVGFSLAAVAGSPTADVRIETVDTAGFPSGTLWATDTNIVSGTLTAAWTLVALTASASISKGQMFAVKIAYASGTSFQMRRSLHVVGGFGLPYYVVNTGTPTKVTTAGGSSGSALLALGSSSTVFYKLAFPNLPISALTEGRFDNVSSGKNGLRFQLPVSARIFGLHHYGQGWNGDFNAMLLDDAGTEVGSSSTAFDGGQFFDLGVALNDLIFDTAVEIAANTWYRAVLEPTSLTDISVSYLTLPSADYRSAMPGGSFWHYTTFDGSSWDDTATDKVPYLDLLIDQIDDGAGGGGGAPGNMSGGLQ